MKVRLQAKLTLLSVAGGLLLALSFPATGGITVLALIALVPLLLVEELVHRNRGRLRPFHLFLQAFLAFLTYNFFTTWWIYNASPFGVFGAAICNSLFMALTFLLFHLTKRELGEKIGYISLVFYWLAFEYLHLTWQLSWPWLTLGNVLAGEISMAQWYEYTGILGGSLWILVTNTGIIALLKRWVEQGRPAWKGVVALVVFIALPVIVSMIIYASESEAFSSTEVVVVQPNIDPYNEKFDGMSPGRQLDKMIEQAASVITDSTVYTVFPETALPHGLWEHELEETPPLATIREFISKYPGQHYITGLSSYRVYQPGEETSITARRLDDEAWYDAYNTAMQVVQEPPVQLYHKSKLVIGVETTPYPQVFGMMEKFAMDLGGITGSLGRDTAPSVFWSRDSAYAVAPVICYESVYGEYVAEYVRRGATMIAIITNDGWWGDTPGYKQHLALGALRAIETRRAIARSANTGISCFIDVKGNIHQATPYWEEAVIKASVPHYRQETFYVRYGDYLGRIAAAFSVLLLAWTIATRLNTTKKRLKL